MDNKKLLKRLQAGTRNYDEANNLHAECYGTIGALEQEVERLKEFILNGYCPEAYGFEGPETFSDCGECIYCELNKGK